MRIALDAMGGDQAPAAPVEGALEALKRLLLPEVREAGARVDARRRLLESLPPEFASWPFLAQDQYLEMRTLFAVLADGATKPAEAAAALGWTPERPSVVRRRMQRTSMRLPRLAFPVIAAGAFLSITWSIFPHRIASSPSGGPTAHQLPGAARRPHRHRARPCAPIRDGWPR